MRLDRVCAAQLRFSASGGVVLALASAAAVGQAYFVNQYNGAAAEENFGLSVAWAGDLNGDGVSDVLVGVPQNATNPVGPGQARIFSGVTGALIVAFTGTVAGDRFGWSVAGIGDVTGDGTPDVVVGAPQAAEAGVATATGYAAVFSGAGGPPVATIMGSSAGDRFGWCVAALGDIDGDGTPDYAIGAPFADPAAGPDAGTVMLSAPAGGTTSLAGAIAGGRFGWSVASAGDLDGDGSPDIVVGMPAASEARTFTVATGAQLFILSGPGASDFGRSVAGIGDVSGDGVPDLLVGAPLADPPGTTNGGTAQAFSGANGLPLPSLSLTGASGDQLGAASSGAGDVTGDGVPDVFVGAPFANPLPGSAGGQARVCSGSTGAPLFSFNGFPGDQLGTSVAAGSDATGDGITDFLVGAPFADPPGFANGGAAKLFSPAGIPGGSYPFGSGCAGSGGITPLITTAGGMPSVTTGNPGFQVILTRAYGGTTAAFLAGSSNSTWLGTPISLPLNLAPLGLPACDLLVSPDVLVLVSTPGAGPANGTLFLPVPVPADPFLVGAAAFLQWFVLDPGVTPFPGAMTEGLVLTLL